MKSKEYTINDFELKSVMLKNSGTWSETSKQFSINLSDILTFLIKRVGKFTKHYASDLFITWNDVEDILHKIPEEDKKEYKVLFGIRENGVDSNSYVLSRLNNTCYDYGAYIGGIYMLDICIEKYNSYFKTLEITVKFGKTAMKEEISNG